MTLSDRLHKTHSDIDVDCMLCRREAAELGMGHLLPKVREDNRPAWLRRRSAKDLTGALR